MATSIIDGTVEEAVLRRRRRLASVYERVVFRTDDGATKTWAKAVVMNNVAELLVPGTRGRFYLFTAMDHRGISGVRADDGREAVGLAKVNELAGLWVFAISAVVILLYVAVLRTGVPLLSLILLILGLPMFFLYRHTRVEAERHFAADSGYRPPTRAQ